MNWLISSNRCSLFLLLCGLVSTQMAFAQKPLHTLVTVNARQQPLANVLKMVAEQGGFYFSYSSDIIPGDSLVSVSVRQKAAGQVVEQLLGAAYHFREKGNYVIILRAAKEKSYTISGHIYDGETASPADFVSIYSRQLLVSTLSDDQGAFRLRIKDSGFPLALAISKVGYGDTTIVVNQAESQTLTVRLFSRPVVLDPLTVRYSEGAGTWLGRLFLSARMRAQSRNIGQFFVSLPYQASLTPGLGTHGKMSAQVVNKFSLNLLGGYTAGVKGVEVAGGFNISKTDVRYVQVAGAFNQVSGHVTGVQVAGFANHVLDSLDGVQVSGFSSLVRRSATGVQVSGFLSKTRGRLQGVQVSGAAAIAGMESVGAQVSGAFNHAADDFRGLQIAGAVNNAKRDFAGVQVSGASNVVSGAAKGMQLSTINVAKVLHGVQIGVVNVADSSSGYSIGLINIIKKGTSNLSVFTNEIVPFNIAWKMGNHKLYSILSAGANSNASRKAYTFGAGFGREFRLRKGLNLITEFTGQNLYLGAWEDLPMLLRFQSGLNLDLSRQFAVSAGSAFNFFHGNAGDSLPGYKSFPLDGYPGFGNQNGKGGWLGWQFGLSWRYGKVR
jgi:hypothetical protein